MKRQGLAFDRGRLAAAVEVREDGVELAGRQVVLDHHRPSRAELAVGGGEEQALGARDERGVEEGRLGDQVLLQDVPCGVLPDRLQIHQQAHLRAQGLTHPLERVLAAGRGRRLGGIRGGLDHGGGDRYDGRGHDRLRSAGDPEE